jgi:hypothetical protein
VDIEKFHKLILFFSLGCLLFIALDAFVFPRKQVVEIVQDKASYSHRRRLTSPVTHTYIIKTDKRQFDTYQELYEAIEIGDTINTVSSKLTNSLQEVMLRGDPGIWIYKEGYLTVFFGMFAVPIIFLGSVVFLIFYRRLNNLEGRKRLTFAILICTIIQLLFYLNN